jgi:hypothetical protein
MGVSRRKLGMQRHGIGVFPGKQQSPAVIVVTHKPLHTSDEWEAAGRPFWSVRYTHGPGGLTDTSAYDLYARTLTPSFCELAIVCLPPIQSHAVLVGTSEKWDWGAWHEYATVPVAMRQIPKSKCGIGRTLITWDRSLTPANHQLYAAAGDIQQGCENPVRLDQTQWKPVGAIPREAQPSKVIEDLYAEYGGES